MRFLMTAALMIGFAMPAVAQKPYEGSLRVRVFDAPPEIDLFMYVDSPAAQKYYSCLQKKNVDDCATLRPRGNYSFTALEGPTAEVTFQWLPPQTYLLVGYAPNDSAEAQAKLVYVEGQTETAIQFGSRISN